MYMYCKSLRDVGQRATSQNQAFLEILELLLHLNIQKSNYTKNGEVWTRNEKLDCQALGRWSFGSSMLVAENYHSTYGS